MVKSKGEVKREENKICVIFLLTLSQARNSIEIVRDLTCFYNCDLEYNETSDMLKFSIKKDRSPPASQNAQSSNQPIVRVINKELPKLSTSVKSSERSGNVKTRFEKGTDLNDHYIFDTDENAKISQTSRKNSSDNEVEIPIIYERRTTSTTYEHDYFVVNEKEPFRKRSYSDRSFQMPKKMDRGGSFYRIGEMNNFYVNFYDRFESLDEEDNASEESQRINKYLDKLTDPIVVEEDIFSVRTDTQYISDHDRVRPQSSRLSHTESRRFREAFKTKTTQEKLPQNFECKYLGKIRCHGLWGLKFVRQSVDELVKQTKRLNSLNDLPDFEALISEQGVHLVQKKYDGNLSTASSRGPTYKSGLLPSTKISYAAQDTIYNKIFACIVVRELSGGESISECYTFLCETKEDAKRMALSLSAAFKEYGRRLESKRDESSLMDNSSLYSSMA